MSPKCSGARPEHLNILAQETRTKMLGTFFYISFPLKQKVPNILVQVS